MKHKTAFYKTVQAIALFAFASTVHAQNRPPDSVVIQESTAQRYIGFGIQPESIITSSISTKKGTELRNGFTNNMSNALYGRLPGLIVNQGSNEPGANNADLFIRGANTFGFSSSPLVIIDGFLADFSQLVPEEIEEISVLKDASATAIYGMRAANGVILVTTKKGHIQPLTVNFSAQYGLQSATSLPNFLNSYDYARLYNEALANDGRPALYTQQDLDLYQNGSDPAFHPNVNWYDQVLNRTAPLSNYNINFKGGNNTVRYFVMLNALTSDGLYKRFGDTNEESSNSLYSRYNFRANVDVSLNKRLTAQLNIGGSIDQKQNPGDLYTNSNFDLIDRIAPNAFPVYNPDGSFGGNSTYPGNPLANLIGTGFSSSNGTTLQSSMRMTQMLDFIAPGLTASVAFSFNNYFLGGSNKRRNYERFSITTDGAGDTIYSAFGQRTSLVPQEPVLSQFRNYALQGSLNYDKTFGRNSFSGLLIYNTDNFNINRAYPNTDPANQAFPYKTNSLGTRLTFVNSGKYIAEFSASYMGAESFPADSRNGFFPAVSLGWIASNEDFLKQSKLVDFLKFRVSYGLVGNENIGGQRFAFAQRYPFAASYFLGTGNNPVTSLGEGRRVNPGVTWEKERKANIGVEVNLARRIGIILDVFQNNRYDILASANGTLPAFLGFNGLPDLNIGEASNRGFEFSLRYNNDTKRAIQFFGETFVSYARSRIDFNGEPLLPNTNLYRTGSAIGQPFGLEAIGLFQSEAEIAASPTPLGVAVRPGDIKYRDIGGPNGVPDGIIDANDVTAIGRTSIPEWNFGFSSGLSYKGFDVNIVMQGVTGVSQYLSGSRYHAFQNFGQVNAMALDRWTEQTAATAAYPRLSADNNQNNYRFSSFWQRDGSFLKLRVAEIGYTFSDRTLSTLRLSQARVFLNGTNLFTLDRIKEGDAEAFYGYPQIRTISVGLRLSLQ